MRQTSSCAPTCLSSKYSMCQTVSFGKSIICLFSKDAFCCVNIVLIQFGFGSSIGGLMQFNYGGPQPLQYAASAAFLAAIYGDYMTAAGVPGWSCGPDFMPKETLRDFARSQVR